MIQEEPRGRRLSPQATLRRFPRQAPHAVLDAGVLKLLAEFRQKAGCGGGWRLRPAPRAVLLVVDRCSRSLVTRRKPACLHACKTSLAKRNLVGPTDAGANQAKELLRFPVDVSTASAGSVACNARNRHITWGLSDAFVLSFARVEVVQPTRGAGRVGVGMSASLVGITTGLGRITAARWALYLASERPTRSDTCKRGCRDRNGDQSLLAHSYLPCSERPLGVQAGQTYSGGGKSSMPLTSEQAGGVRLGQEGGDEVSPRLWTRMRKALD